MVKVYRESVDVPSILRDAAAIEASPGERLARALPFGGTLESPPPPRSYNPYGRELLGQRPIVFPVSARQARQAKEAIDADQRTRLWSVPL